jgi:diphthamide synthase (EF-2-diphthine--ammonia ligase)
MHVVLPPSATLSLTHLIAVEIRQRDKSCAAYTTNLNDLANHAAKVMAVQLCEILTLTLEDKITRELEQVLERLRPTAPTTLG